MAKKAVVPVTPVKVPCAPKKNKMPMTPQPMMPTGPKPKKGKVLK
jgi:hypothetical protein